MIKPNNHFEKTDEHLTFSELDVVPNVTPRQATIRATYPMILKKRARPPNLPELEPPGVGYGKTGIRCKRKG
jgi:hypothetical protein